MSDKKYIFEKLNASIKNPIGVYALMGNLRAESNFKPKNLQNSYEKKLNFNDDTYTKAVDSGKYTKFVRDCAGYGLAQWTYWSRKQALLLYAKRCNKSIGDLDMQLAFLVDELHRYVTVWKAITTGTSLKEISDIVMCQYERPADQSERAKNLRASYGESIKKELEEIIDIPVVEELDYYPQVTIETTSIIDALKSIGVDSSKENRKKIAYANGILDYSFKSNQNTKMLKLAKQGLLKKGE